MTAETDRILGPETEDLSLPESGIKVRVKRLRTKQFFLLVRIITRGGAHLVPELDWSDPDQFEPMLFALISFSIPEAGDEAVEFLHAMAQPVDPSVKHPTLRSDDEPNKPTGPSLWEQHMSDPAPGDTLAIMERIVRQESDDMRALGNRIRSMLEVVRKTGATEPDAPTPVKAPIMTNKDQSTEMATTS